MGRRKIVLITGASRGIGRALALAFGRHEYAVIVNYLREKEKAVLVVDEIARSGGCARSVRADVGDPVQVQRMIETIAAQEGRIDVLVNNAGVARDGGILRITPQEWNIVLQTNLTGAFFVMQQCARMMVKQKEGAIINIASIAGLRGAPGAANYASAKAGISALTKSAAKELGRFNVRVNAVMPGFHLTDMGQSVPGAYVRRAKEDSVLGCTTAGDEMAAFIVFLAGMRTVSGQIFNWDSRII